MEGRVVTGALVVVVAVEVGVTVAGEEVGAVVRGEDNHRILIQPLLLQLCHQTAQILVQAGALAQVIWVLLQPVAPQDLQILGQNKVLEPLLGALRPLVVLSVVLVVGLDLGDGHEEGFFAVILVEELQGQVVDAVGPVALEVDAPVVFVKDEAVVAVRGELQHIGGAPEAGVAPPQLAGDGGDGVVDGGGLLQLPVAGQVPLADVGGLIARLLNIVAQGLYPGGQHDVVAEAAGLGGPLARLEQGPAGAAHRLGGKGVVKLDPLPGQPVQVGRDVQGLAEAATGVPALLVGKVENDVVGR